MPVLTHDVGAEEAPDAVPEGEILGGGDVGVALGELDAGDFVVVDGFGLGVGAGEGTSTLVMPVW